MGTTYFSPGFEQLRKGAAGGMEAASRPQVGPRSPSRETPGDRQIHLTPRQREVLLLLCAGLPNKLISRQLSISAGTVKVHIGCILRELEVSSRVEAVVLAYRLGLSDENALTEAEPA